MRLDIDFEPIVYLSIQTDSSWSPRTFLGVGTRVGNKKTSDGKQPIYRAMHKRRRNILGGRGVSNFDVARY